MRTQPKRVKKPHGQTEARAVSGLSRTARTVDIEHYVTTAKVEVARDRWVLIESRVPKEA